MSTITLQVVRGDQQNGSVLESYEVPYRDGMSVLDAVFWIREHRDPSLSVRYSCRSANACKECSAVINGKAGYLCTIRAVPEQEFRIEPLKGRTWIKDLVTALD